MRRCEGQVSTCIDGNLNAAIHCMLLCLVFDPFRNPFFLRFLLRDHSRCSVPPVAAVVPASLSPPCPLLTVSSPAKGNKFLRGAILYSKEPAMAFCHGRDFLFCGMCGTLLSIKSVDFAECPLCGFKRNASEIEGKEIRYAITAEDIRRELKIEPFVILESAKVEEETVQRAVVNEACPQCNNPQLEYYTKQLRSADEGQTVFYECPECGYKYSLNT